MDFSGISKNKNLWLVGFSKLQKHRKYFVQKVFLDFCKIHRKTPVLGSFLIVLQLYKKNFNMGAFAKLLPTTILKNICERLLLKTVDQMLI